MEPYNPNKPWLSVNLPSREELIAMAMGLIPGGRALKYYHDNPEGPATEFADLLAEDIVPEYRNLIKPALTGEDIDWEDAAKEAAMFGTPVKSRKGRMSTRARVNATADARTPADVPAGPYRETNTGSNLVNQGQQMTNTNTVSTTRGTNVTGANAWQGNMYPPGRSLARLEEYGPYVWDKATDQREYIRKLNDIINENENKWEYLINKTRSKAPEGARKVQSRSIVPKEDLVSIALAQGRPDIAARVMADNEIRVNYTQSSKPGFNQRFRSYKNAQATYPMFKDNAVWKDYGNRQVEKELREQFAMLPEDDLIRYKFADYYGVPDLYNDWKANPEYWKEFRDNTDYARRTREATNKYLDIKYGRQLEE